MKRAAHIIREIAAGIAHTASAAYNTARLGGDMYTSTSARAHMETHDGSGNLRHDAPQEWLIRRRKINRIFWRQDDHCRAAWEADFMRAVAKFQANAPAIQCAGDVLSSRRKPERKAESPDI